MIFNYMIDLKALYIDFKRYVPLCKIKYLLPTVQKRSGGGAISSSTSDIFSDNYISILEKLQYDSFEKLRARIVKSFDKDTAQFFINYRPKPSAGIHPPAPAGAGEAFGKYYVLDKNIFIVFYNDYLVKIDFKNNDISLLGVLAMDCGFMKNELDNTNFFNVVNPILNFLQRHTQEEVNSTIGLFVDPSFYEYYLTSKKRGAYMIRAINSLLETRVWLKESYKINIYPAYDMNKLILKNFNYKKLSDSVKAQNPSLGPHDIITNLHLAFQNEASVQFITNKFNSLMHD